MKILLVLNYLQNRIKNFMGLYTINTMGSNTSTNSNAVTTAANIMSSNLYNQFTSLVTNSSTITTSNQSVTITGVNASCIDINGISQTSYSIVNLQSLQSAVTSSKLTSMIASALSATSSSDQALTAALQTNIGDTNSNNNTMQTLNDVINNFAASYNYSSFTSLISSIGTNQTIDLSTLSASSGCAKIKNLQQYIQLDVISSSIATQVMNNIFKSSTAASTSAKSTNSQKLTAGIKLPNLTSIIIIIIVIIIIIIGIFLFVEFGLPMLTTKKITGHGDELFEIYDRYSIPDDD